MKGFARRRPLTSFFALALAITWGLEASLMLGLPGLPAGLVLQVAGAGPSLAGIAIAWAADGRQGLKSLYARVLRWRVGVGWYLAVLVLFPTLLVGVVAAAITLSGQPFRSAFPGSWWLWPAFMPLVLFLGPLQEELGWRAFALPTLLDRVRWVPASLVLGGVWAVWHRTPSTLLEPLGPAGLAGLFLGAVVPDVALSVLMTWVYLRTGGSALLAGLGMHTAANFALFLPSLPTGSEALATTWWTTGAFAGCLTVLAIAAAVSGAPRTARGPRYR